MAVTITLYNHTVKLFANQQVALTGLKVMLLLGHTFDATDTDLTGLTADEVDGNGWDTGGEALASEVVSIVDTNDAMLDANDLAVTATGGPIGPADGAAIVDGTNSLPLAYVDFGEEKTADVGTQFLVTLAATGIVKWTYTPA